MNNWREAVEAELDEPTEDHVWEALESNGDTEDLALGLVTPSQVAAKARKVSAALNGPAARPVPGDWDMPGLPQAGEAARARIDALSTIYAAWADNSPEVRRFRDTVLASRRTAMAAATGATTPTSENGSLLRESEVHGWVQWCFAADSPDGDGDRHIRELIASTSPRGPRRVNHLWYVADRQERAITVDARGALGQLAKLAENLSDQYRWRPSGATMLVLAGRRPEVFVYLGSAEIRYNEASATTRVTMTLDPALNEEDVAGIYGRLRQRFHPKPPKYVSVRRYRLAAHVGPHVQVRVGTPGSRLGPGRPPTPGPSGLAVFLEPVAGHTWEGMRRDWNEIYGDQGDEGTGRNWRYDSASNFIRDAKIAMERLLYPGWTSRL